MIDHLTGWGILAAVVVGHFGLSIALYNRINGFGLPRKLIKGIVLVVFCLTLLIPIWVIAFHYPSVSGFALNPTDAGFDHVPRHLLGYASVCLASWIVLGVPWLLWRPVFGLEWATVKREVEVVDVQANSRRLGLTAVCKLQSRIPFNQIFDLAVESIDLPVPGLPPALDGYRIAHLSDLHLTGHVHPDFSRYAVERSTLWQPDMMVLTGDIIDYQPCIDWLPEIFAQASARDGCFFVLGNHDTRIVDASQTREAMDQAGWTDLGSRTVKQNLSTVPTLLIGNEYPWFGRPQVIPDGCESFRLLLSHTPDQIGWARQNNVTLMLAGHTHGGQGRLPLLGPILSPSFHGSRYASGDFYKPPTTMHVSRGLSGTHLLRINCRPELSLLTLRAIDSL